jgi:hypothetical protein
LIGFVDGVKFTSQNAAISEPIVHPSGDNVSVESHGDDEAGWGEYLTRPPELCGSPTSRNIWKQAVGMEEGVRILHISI